MIGKRKAALARMKRVVKRTQASRTRALAAPVLAIEDSSTPIGRKPEVDYRLVYETRRKSLVPNLGADEAHFRAFDFAVSFCREHSGCDLEQAKALVRAAIAKAATQ
jgi:hypothetical protein